MYSIRAEFASRAALREALLDTFAEGGIFLQGHYDVTSGSPVTVRLSAPALEPGVFLEGMVQWRRLGAQSRASGVPAGLGVRMLTDQSARFAFLQRWADGQTAELQRLEWRVPLGSTVHVTAEQRATRQILHTRFRDVSERGACVSTPTRLPTLVPMRIEFPVEGAMRGVRGRVVWSTDERAGVAIEPERGEERAAWQRLLERAESALQVQRASLKPLSIKPSVRPPK